MTSGSTAPIIQVTIVLSQWCVVIHIFLYVGQLTSNDIDCTEDVWKHGCTSEYCTRMNDAIAKTALVMSIPYIISAALSPPLGFLIDRIGMRAVVSLISPTIIVIVHAMFAYTTVDPVGLLVGQGLAYTGKVYKLAVFIRPQIYI